MKYTKPIIISLIGFIVFSVLFFSAVGVAIYKFNYEGRIVKGASYLIPYPIARINRHFVKYSDFLFDVDALEHFYEVQESKAGMPIPDKKMLKQNILERLIQNYFLEELAKENNVFITRKEMEERYKQISEENKGEENLKKMLKDFYNWDSEDFKKRVIYYTLLDEELTEVFGDEQKLKDALKDEIDKAVIKRYVH